MADLCEDGQDKEHQPQDEIAAFAVLTLRRQDQEYAGKGHEDSQYIDEGDLLLEKGASCDDGDDRHGSDDHCTDRRRTGLLYAIGLAQEIDEGLEERQKHELPEVLPCYRLEITGQQIE